MRPPFVTRQRRSVGGPEPVTAARRVRARRTLLLARRAGTWLLTLVVVGSGSMQSAVSGASGDALRARMARPLPLVAAIDVAKALGLDFVVSGATFTMTGPAGVVTGSSGSVDGRWTQAGGRETQITWSSPVMVEEGVWWIPLDATELWGARVVDGVRWESPDGRAWRIDLPATVDGPGVRGVVVRPAPGVVVGELDLFGDASVMAWVADPATLPLVRPDLTAALDGAWASAGDRASLLWIVTASREATSLPRPVVERSGRATGAQVDGFAMDGAAADGDAATVEDLVGGRDRVGPSAPWVAVVWLPPGITTSDALRIGWGTAFVEVRFRP